MISSYSAQLRYCYDEAYFFYHKNLLMGFAIDDFKRAASKCVQVLGFHRIPVQLAGGLPLNPLLIPGISWLSHVEPQGNTSLRIP